MIIEQTIATLHNKSKPCYIINTIASLRMGIWTLEEEAARLAERFAGVNRAEFARNFEFPGGDAMIYQHITGRRPISLEAAQIYAQGLGCTLEEISPRLAVDARKAYQTLAEYNVENGPDLRGRVPLISWVQAGDWQEIVDTFAPGDAEEWRGCPVNHGSRTFVLRVRGESMFNPNGRPSFQQGDLIFVDPDRHAEHGALVVVRLDDDKEATFKKLVIEGERKYLRALNPAWPEPIIKINGNATICGVVIFKGEDV